MSPGRASRLAPRVFALFLGCAAALALWFSYRAWVETRELARREANRKEIRDLVAEHAREGSVAVPGRATDPRDPVQRPYFLSEAMSAKLFLRDRSTQTYDPWCYFRPKSNQSTSVPWPEHPAGRWTYATSSIGLRDDEILDGDPDLRILVTGDSHTEGFCENSESFPNLLEASLARSRPGQVVEVLNAADGGYGFYNYLGVLEKFLPLEPDVFVVAVYGGNDFYDSLLHHAWFELMRLPERTQAEAEKIQRGEKTDSSLMTQLFYALLFFKERPEWTETSLRGGVRLMGEMKAVCDEHGIRMLCVYIPEVRRAPGEDGYDAHQALARDLGLTEEDLGLVDRMADLFLGALRARELAVLDARELFVPEDGPYYWVSDQHMNLRAHAKIAAGIEAWLREE